MRRRTKDFRTEDVKFLGSDGIEYEGQREFPIDGEDTAQGDDVKALTRSGIETYYIFLDRDHGNKQGVMGIGNGKFKIDDPFSHVEFTLIK